MTMVVVQDKMMTGDGKEKSAIPGVWARQNKVQHQTMTQTTSHQSHDRILALLGLADRRHHCAPLLRPETRARRTAVACCHTVMERTQGGLYMLITSFSSQATPIVRHI